MGSYILKRFLQMVPVIWIVTLIVFLIMRVLPGDPAQLMLLGSEGSAANPALLAEMRAQMGLDRSIAHQYFAFLFAALTGDLGTSMRGRMPVTELIVEQFPATLELAVSGLAVALALGVPLGILAAVRQNTWTDAVAMSASYVGASMPIYFFGLVLILFFSFDLRWFPSAGRHGLQSLILPALTLGFVSAGLIARLVRSSMIEVLSEDFVRTARAKGMSERIVVWRHALRNALIPVVTLVGLQFGSMLAGAVVTETVFSRPGIGRLTVAAIQAKDYPLVQGCVLFLAVVYLLVNLIVDVLYAYIDPRIRFGH
jgi:ABC-type dipeptide/oligopeptide/nickel transport system permease component